MINTVNIGEELTEGPRCAIIMDPAAVASATESSKATSATPQQEGRDVDEEEAGLERVSVGQTMDPTATMTSPSLTPPGAVKESEANTTTITAGQAPTDDALTSAMVARTKSMAEAATATTAAGGTAQDAAAAATQALQVDVGFTDPGAAAVWKALVLARSKSMAEAAAAAAVAGANAQDIAAAAVDSIQEAVEGAAVLKRSPVDNEAVPAKSAKRAKAGGAGAAQSQSSSVTQLRGEFSWYVEFLCLQIRPDGCLSQVQSHACCAKDTLRVST